MQVQNMVWAPAVITVLTALANIPINVLLIAWYDFWGAALATSVARILQLALLCGTSPTLTAVCCPKPSLQVMLLSIFASYGTGCVGLCHPSCCQDHDAT